MDSETQKADRSKARKIQSTVKRLLRRLAEKLLMRARKAEPDVTADMRSVERMGARLIGLDYRVKSLESLSGKIAREAREGGVTMREAAEGITDVLRYTVAARSESYSRIVPCAIRSLSEKGYDVAEFRNAWGEKFYQGVNVHFVSPAGVRVEVQFHTPQSFAVKQASHEVYEIRRSADSTPEEIARAVQKSIDYNAMVRPPAGATRIAWPMVA